MIQKQAFPINFAQGLDTKTDPFQVSMGKFLKLTNSVFTKGNLLLKRNGFGPLPSLPMTGSVYLTTLNGNLTALGNSIQAYSEPNASWINKGTFQPVSLSVLPVARSAINQTQCDSVVALNGFICTVYTEINNGTSSYKYVIADSVTGQNIIYPTIIPVQTGTVTGSPRVFVLGGYFIIAFTNDISGTFHLQYIAVSIARPTIVTLNADLAAGYVPAPSLSWDGIVVGNNLYFAYYTAAGGGAVDINYLTSGLQISSPISFSGSVATHMSVSADLTNAANPIIYASFYDSGSSTGYVVAVDTTLQKVMTATQIIASGTIYNITSAAQNGIVTSLYEVENQYSYDSSLASNFVQTVPVTLPATVTTGMVGSTTTVLRSVGLASKAFIYSEVIYCLFEYASSLQSTYFLSNLSGSIVARFAYENGGASLVTSAGYLPVGLPQAQVIGSNIYIAYLFKDLIESQNTLGLIQSIGPAGKSNIYTQSGVNLITVGFNSLTLGSSEIGSNLNITGGLLWAYDGQTLDEQGFNVFPDNIEATWSETGGAIVAKPDGSTNTDAYYVQVIYQWTDAAGNVIQSAPSIPIPVTTTGSGTAGSITYNIPTLRLSYKTGVKILIYRWSVANQIYYQVTSLTAPTLNNPAVDSIAYVDTLADASIVGNSIIYTTGGVLEDIPGPSAIATTLFDDRLWLIDAEDRNLLWFSKQIIESTPVEMSDQLTRYIAPSTGAQGSTGPMTAIFPMDDKIIIFKKDAIYYINGTGPDNTGANAQYSEPIFITSSVGCANQNSLVIMPAGIMFQSDKGIWLLSRDLTTSYIGAPVEEFNAYLVGSATAIPGTNQVRFTLSNGIMLMFDYYYQQWGTFEISAISSTLYQGLHTCLNSNGMVFQETDGVYLDNGNPVLMDFVTSWLAMAGIQGYQRAYWFFLLGTYYSPHKLNCQIAYDFNPSPQQSTMVKPVNFGPIYGSSAMPVYGGLNPCGGGGVNQGGTANVETGRVFLTKQRCTSFQVSIQEIYDPSYGLPAGQGLSLSGLNLVVAIKKGWRTQPAATSYGTPSANQ